MSCGPRVLDVALQRADGARARDLRHEGGVGEVLVAEVDGQHLAEAAPRELQREPPLVAGEVDGGERGEVRPRGVEHRGQHVAPRRVDLLHAGRQVARRARAVRQVELVEPLAAADVGEEPGVEGRGVHGGSSQARRCSPTRTIFMVFVPPDLPMGSPMVTTMRSPSLRGAALHEHVLGLVEELLAVVADVAHDEREDAAEEGRAVAGGGLRGERVDGHAAVEAAHPQRGRPRLGEGGDGLHLQVEGGEERGHRDRLVDALEDAVEELLVQR